MSTTFTQGALRGMFVTGTGTDVGKSLVTAALSRALWQAGCAHIPLKPVQTGVLSAEDADASLYAAAHVGLTIPSMHAPRTLFSYTLAASPHLAAAQEEKKLCVHDICASITNLHAAMPLVPLLMEGAGGLYVPLNTTESLLDVMQVLDLPTVLVMRNTLGALNHTLLSLDVLRQRGVKVCALICKEVDTPATPQEQSIRCDNVAYLRQYLQDSETLVLEMPHVTTLDAKGWDVLAQSVQPLVQHYTKPWARCATTEEAQSFKDWDALHLWHPYTSALTPLPTYEVTHAKGTRLFLRDGTALVDGMSSWWCTVHGYGKQELVQAVQQQAGRLSHVMFGGITHEPAVQAAQKLMALLPKAPSDNAALSRLFWADSGSVAVEVALKMALQYQQGVGQAQRHKILSPRGGYYGDTLGAMSLCDPINGMHVLFNGVLPQHIFIERPSCTFTGGLACPFDEASMQPMEDAFIKHGKELAAVILEPVVQGAGGMYFYHPRYLQRVRELCHAYGVLLICDEIATGFGRTGKMFAHEWCAEYGQSVSPDIVCVGKALTGGMMTLAATLCTETVAQGICTQGNVFMHGPTFMANPLACAAAAASLDLLMTNNWQEQVLCIESALKEGLAPCIGHEHVQDVRVLGAIGVVEMRHPVDMAKLQAFFVQQGVWIRPFGKLVYVMPPYVSTAEDIALLCKAVCAAVQQGQCG